MAGEGKMAGETDKMDREAQRAHRQAAHVWGDVGCLLCTPVMCFMYYRCDVKQTSDVFVLFCFVSPPRPPVPKWENNSLVWLFRSSTGRSICIGPSVNMRFLQVIS